jgi:hypothetical protein
LSLLTAFAAGLEGTIGRRSATTRSGGQEDQALCCLVEWQVPDQIEVNANGVAGTLGW